MSNPNHALALIYLPFLDQTFLDQQLIMVGYFSSEVDNWQTLGQNNLDRPR